MIHNGNNFPSVVGCRRAFRPGALKVVFQVVLLYLWECSLMIPYILCSLGQYLGRTLMFCRLLQRCVIVLWLWGCENMFYPGRYLLLKPPLFICLFTQDYTARTDRPAAKRRNDETELPSVSSRQRATPLVEPRALGYIVK